MKRIHFPVPSSLVLVAAWLTVALVMAALSLNGILTISDQNDKIDSYGAQQVENRRDIGDLKADTKRQQVALDQANAKLVNAGRRPILPPINLQASPVTRYVPIPGPVGKQGKTGDKGDSVTGAPGESITGNTGLTGPMGDPGTNGTDGKDGEKGDTGKGVQSQTCNEDGSWTINYDDGTSQNTPGPCRVVTGPPPA